LVPLCARAVHREDDEKQAMNEVQKLTDQHIEKIGEILKKFDDRLPCRQVSG
jgi:ribosome recycling factor